MPCESIKTPAFTGIICRGRGRKAPPCRYCGKPGDFLCDHSVIRKGQRATCDTRMCIDCTNHVWSETDLCRPHFNLWRNNGNKFKLGDIEVAK